MIRNFILWFIVFGLSFLVSSIGIADQGVAFIFMHLGFSVIFLIIVTIMIAAGGIAGKDAVVVSFSSIMLVSIIFETVIVLIATWGATKLFNIDFFVAYQIMTFGQCLDLNNNSNKNQ